jgi:hypothetical protein
MRLGTRDGRGFVGSIDAWQIGRVVVVCTYCWVTNDLGIDGRPSR